MKCVCRRPQEGVGAPGAGDTGDCEPVFMGFEQQVPLITEPFLKASILYFHPDQDFPIIYYY